jgi:hypothetical protein
MKILRTIPIIVFCMASIQVHAQSEIPKGYKKGTILLADSTPVAGYIKENIKSGASVLFLAEQGGKKRSYTGGDLISTEIDGTTFLCIKGDFFKVICSGDLSFLQKSSDASGKPSYNGTEVVFSNGTEGSPNDYFIYDNRSKQLQLVSRKNFSEVITATFADYTAAMDKAKTTSGDIAQLKDAVEFYNRRNSK